MEKNKKRRKVRSHIACDFIAADGTRVTAFQLLTIENERPVAIAGIDILNGEVQREYAVPELKNKFIAIRRLAQKALVVSQPQKFNSAPDNR